MAVLITYFVHGTTVDNERGLASGWSDTALSETGVRQSKELTDLVKTDFDAVFCSDLRRAVDSAQISFGGRCSITKDRRLRECNYGDLNGKPDSDFVGGLAAYIDRRFPNGESYIDVQMRISDFLDYLRKTCDGKHVAIVAHRAPQLALDVIIKGMSWQQAMDADWRKTHAWKPGWDYTLS